MISAEADIGKADQRIAFVTVGIPHATDGASVVLYYHYLKAVVDAGYKVQVVIVGSKSALSEEALTALRTSLGAANRVEVVTVTSAPAIALPSRLGIHVDLTGKEELAGKLSAFEPDVVVAMDLPAAILIGKTPIYRTIAWIGDLRFESEWYHFIYNVRERWASVRHFPYAMLQRRAWKKIYQTILFGCEEIIVASKSSEKALAKIGITARFAPYPWPNAQQIDVDYLRQPPQKPTFLFYGHLFGLGSRSSLHFLFSRLYPELQKIWGKGGFDIIVGGREAPPNWAMTIIRERPEFRYVGFIENLTEMLARVHAAIAPLDVPVGNRSRILTAQAKRALVIAHDNAACGNPYLVDMETCLLARNATDFARRMRLAVEDPSVVKGIVARAEASYLENYDPPRAVRHMLDALEGCLSKAAGSQT